MLGDFRSKYPTLDSFKLAVKGAILEYMELVHGTNDEFAPDVHVAVSPNPPAG